MTFTTVFTAHHNYGVWQEQLGIRFVHFPFAMDTDLFKHYHEPKQYDLGFSGSLHTAWTDFGPGSKNVSFDQALSSVRTIEVGEFTGVNGRQVEPGLAKDTLGSSIVVGFGCRQLRPLI